VTTIPDVALIEAGFDVIIGTSTTLGIGSIKRARDGPSAAELIELQNQMQTRALR